jgi:hypothetical protein
VLPCRQATGGCEAYTVRKQAVRIELRNRPLLRKPTPLLWRKAVSGQPPKRGCQESPESVGRGMLSNGFPMNPGKSPYLSRNMGTVPPNPKRTRSQGHEGVPHGKRTDPRRGESRRPGKPEAAVTDRRELLRTHSTDEGGEPQGSRKGRPRYPPEGRGKQVDVPTW